MMMMLMLGSIGTTHLYDVEYTWWQSGVQVDISQHDGGQWSQWRWLEDDRVTGSQCWTGLPDGHLEWVVPRANSTHDTQRLSASVSPAAIRQRHVLACRQVSKQILTAHIKRTCISSGIKHSNKL